MTQQLAEWVMSTDKHTGLSHACMTVMSNHASEEGEVHADSRSLADELGCDPSTVRKVVAGLLADGSLKRSGDTGQFTIFTPFKSPPAPDSGACVDLTECDSNQVNSTENLEQDETVGPANAGAPAGLGKEAPKKGERTDYLFEALCRVSGLDYQKLTPSERSRVNDARKQLKAVEATPEEVVTRAANWNDTFPGAVFSVHALVANWSTLGDGGMRRVDPVRAVAGGHHDFDEEWGTENENIGPLGAPWKKKTPHCGHGFVYNAAGVSTCSNECIRSGSEKEAREWLRL